MPKKMKAPCRGDNRGGAWIGLPACLINSPAYQHLSVHARAVLVELAAKMNGYNNGQITASQRELCRRVRCSPRKMVGVFAELFEHGLIAIEAEAKWQDNRAREFRLTFVSTPGRGATNDYLDWAPRRSKNNASAAVAKESETDATSEANSGRTAAYASAALATRRAYIERRGVTCGEPPINKPYPGRETEAASIAPTSSSGSPSSEGTLPSGAEEKAASSKRKSTYSGNLTKFPEFNLSLFAARDRTP